MCRASPWRSWRHADFLGVFSLIRGEYWAAHARGAGGGVRSRFRAAKPVLDPIADMLGAAFKNTKSLSWAGSGSRQKTAARPDASKIPLSPLQPSFAGDVFNEKR